MLCYTNSVADICWKCLWIWRWWQDTLCFCQVSQKKRHKETWRGWDPVRQRYSSPTCYWSQVRYYYYCLYDLVWPLFKIRTQCTQCSSVSTGITALKHPLNFSCVLCVDHMFSVYRSTVGQENDLSVIYSSIKISA